MGWAYSKTMKSEVTLQLDPEVVRQARAICEALPEKVTVSSLISKILADFVRDLGPVAEAARGGDLEARAQLERFSYGGDADRDSEP